MRIKVLETRTGRELVYYSWNEVKNLFSDCMCWLDNHILKSDYDSYLAELDDEEKAAFIEYWQDRDIIVMPVEYYTELIESEVWTSPRGIESEFKVISIEA